MARTAQDYLDVLRSWIGYSEHNGKYRTIIDLYNSAKPLPRGYKVSYGDAWCDVTVSAAAIQAGITDLVGRECGCEEHVKIFKQMGIWKEDGTVIPQPGYIIVYNWDGASQPNDGYSDHIGVVESVSGDTITCIEGNKNGAVARRTIPVGWGCIRGYAAPRYENTSSPEPSAAKFPLNKNPKWIGIVSVKEGSSLNVRTWAGTENRLCSFSPLGRGTEVSVCDTLSSSTGETWYYIKYNGLYGFVHSAYIKEK